MDALVERARSGDRQAIEQLLNELAPAVHRFGLRMCKNAHDAEDVLQDTLIQIVAHIKEFEGRGSLPSWVFALARSACARRRRGLKNAPPAGDEALAEQVSSEPSPEQLAGKQELGALLARALDALPDAQREVLLLRDVEGLSAPETAAALTLSVDAVKSRLHRARVELREQLAPLFATPPAVSCPDVMSLWSRKLDGDLSQQDCAEMERHLESCAHCRLTCDGLKRALDACASLRSANVPERVREQIRAALQASDRVRR
jgi:RNA polymerase sigma-70 factor (ECF subfamily)